MDFTEVLTPVSPAEVALRARIAMLEIDVATMKDANSSLETELEIYKNRCRMFEDRLGGIRELAR